MATRDRAQTAAPGKMTFGRRLYNERPIHLMILPSVIVVILMSYLPMYGILIAFKRFDVYYGVWNSPWAKNNGFEHFVDFFNSPDALLVIRNTIVIALLKLVVLSLPPVILALMINEMRNGPFKKINQTITYLPHFVTWVVVAGIMQTFLNVRDGPINLFLVKIGLFEKPVNFLMINNIFWPILLVSDFWKSVGWSSIIYLGVIATIDPNLYEAAEMDGAKRLQKAFHITWPHLLQTFMILFILDCGRIMQGLGSTFDQCYILGHQLNREVSDIIDTYILRIGLEQGRFDFSTAVGLFKSIINLILLLSANTLSRKITQKSLF